MQYLCYKKLSIYVDKKQREREREREREEMVKEWTHLDEITWEL